MILEVDDGAGLQGGSAAAESSGGGRTRSGRTATTARGAAAGAAGAERGDDEEAAPGDLLAQPSAPAQEAAAASAAADGAANSDNDGGRIHRSLPRIKTVLSDEAYLSGILNILEQSGAPNFPYASTSNGWTTAFHNVYATLALDCHHPTGKNRHHKFKDKMVEIWAAMEAEVLAGRRSAEDPLYALGLRQLEAYRAAAASTDEAKGLAQVGADDGAAAHPEERASSIAASPLVKAKRGEGSGSGAAAAAVAVAAAGLGAPAKAAEASPAAAAAAPSAEILRPPPPPRRGRPPKFRPLPGHPGAGAAKAAPAGASGGAPPSSATTNPPPGGRVASGQALMQVVARLDRIEALAFDSLQAPGGAPGGGSARPSRAMEASPRLRQLHRLVVQNRRGVAAAAASDARRGRHAEAVRPYYESAVRDYLSKLPLAGGGGAGAGAAPSADVVADDLYASLQEMEALLQAIERDVGPGAGLAGEVHDAYRRQLSSYLEAVDPGLARELEAAKSAGARSSSGGGGKKRPSAAMDEDDGGAGDDDRDPEDEEGGQGIVVDV